MIKKPPSIETLPEVIFSEITQKHPEKLSEYFEFYKPLDNKGRYLPYDEFRHRVPSHLDPTLAWALTKLSRIMQYSPLIYLGEPSQPCHFIFTPTVQKALSHTDRHTTTGALEWMSSKIGEEHHFKYLLKDLIEDEAVSSSQLEGAATTTLIAKDMLKRNRKPRTPDEKMILGNLKMMTFAWNNRNQPLSLDLILEMHKIGTEDIDNEKYTPGVFRKTDDVAVVDSDGETVYVPPTAKDIKKRLKKIVEWANAYHEVTESREYIHPLIKAICLHFAIGFEHPFRDGNGRVARTLFYWFMFKNDYAAFRYIAISTLLKRAPIKYGKSYLYTETDDMDLTFFIDYQCSVILRTIHDFKLAYQKTCEDVEAFNRWIWESGLYGKLSEKQRIIFQVAKGKANQSFTAANVKENLDCSYNTASTALNGLVEIGVFEKKKKGREWTFFMLEKETILKRRWVP